MDCDQRREHCPANGWNRLADPPASASGSSGHGSSQMGLSLMNVVTLDHYAGSPSMGMEYRPYALSRELNRRGHHCVVVAGSYSHLRRQNPESRHGGSWHTTVDGIDWYWIPTRQYQGNGVRRTISMLDFTARTWLLADRLARIEKPDVVIASSTYPLDVYAAARIAKLADAALVFEVHDMWPLTPQLLGGLSQHHPFIWTMQRAEDYYCRHADLVISVLPNAIEHLATRGLPADRYVVVPNGVDLTADVESQPPPEVHVNVFRKARSAGRFVVLYAGSLGLANNLGALVEAVGLLHELPVELIILGKGPELETLKKLASQGGPSNVSFLAPVPRYQLHDLIALADVCYAGVAKSPLYRYGISLNKVYEYMMAGACILFAGAADVFNDLVTEAGAGISVPHSTPEDIAAGIQRLYAMTREERTRLGLHGADYCKRHFTYDVLGERYEDALRAACRNHGQRS